MRKDKKITEFINSLKSVAMVSREEGISVQAVYSRIRKGQYETVTICNTLYIITKQ